jgi:hypothetical protein
VSILQRFRDASLARKTVFVISAGLFVTVLYTLLTMAVLPAARLAMGMLIQWAFSWAFIVMVVYVFFPSTGKLLVQLTIKVVELPIKGLISILNGKPKKKGKSKKDEEDDEDD